MEKIEEIEQWQQTVQLETQNGAALWKAIHISLILTIFFCFVCFVIVYNLCILISNSSL